MNSERSTYQHSQSRWLVRIMYVAVMMTCLHVWFGPVHLLNEVQAQLPDSALQRKHILEETRQINRLLTEIKQILKTGTLHVRIQGADNKSDTHPVPSRGW